MSILVDSSTRIITQGITGKTGQFHTRMCREYANGRECYVAGVNPRKPGEDFDGIRETPSGSGTGSEEDDGSDAHDRRSSGATLQDHLRAQIAGMRLDGEDLAALEARLRRYPNFVVDLSAREAEMGRQPYTSRAFLIRWQDRVLFGTDRYPGRPDQPRHRLYYRLLETADEYFKYYDHPFPPTGEWRVYGLHLPDGVLKKIYQSNADRVLGWRVRDRRR